MLTAATGATLRELMDRMGHSTTTRASLIYLHGSDARQHEIAGALSHHAQQIAGLAGDSDGETSQGSGHVSGTRA